jgi:hypothetical protein
MPALKYYVVNITHEVKVSATNSTDAVALAKRAMEHTMHPEDQINIWAMPYEVGLSIREDH